MKKSKKSTFSASGKIAGAASALFSLVAIFTMFASAFNEEDGNARGSLFKIMFGDSWKTNPGIYNPIWPLIIAFALAIIAVLVALSATVLNGAAKKGALAGALVCNGATIALTMFECQFYEAANGVALETTGTTYIGAAPICVAVFCGLAILIDLFSLVYKGEAE